MQIKNIKPHNYRNSAPVNVVRNICNYTWNIAPKTLKNYKKGALEGEQFAKTKNLGNTGTYISKKLYATKNVIKSVSPFEIPAVLSVLAIPVPFFLAMPVAFAAGCVLISPVFIKKFLSGELSAKDIQKFLSNMKQKDFIVLDEKIKNTVKTKNKV